MSDNPNPVGAGQSVTYTINYANSGQTTLTGVVITDFLPTGSIFVSASEVGVLMGDISVAWEIGNLEPGKSGVVNVVVHIPSDSTEGSIYCNTVVIDSNETEAVCVTENTTDPFLTGPQTFYVLGWAPEVLSLLSGSNTDCPAYSASSSAGIHSVLSISNAAGNDVTAYIRNYADTSTFNPSDPLPPGNKILTQTIHAGEVWTIDNIIYSSYAPTSAGN